MPTVELERKWVNWEWKTWLRGAEGSEAILCEVCVGNNMHMRCTKWFTAYYSLSQQLLCDQRTSCPWTIAVRLKFLLSEHGLGYMAKM